MTSQSRNGFTLIELLIVIAIIGILMSLLVPAVHSARARARTMQCANNLKQLGIALQSYESNWQQFPAAGIVADKTRYEPRSGLQFSWIVQLLPHLEQENLYRLFSTKHDIFHQPHEPQATHLETLVCPSDGRNRDFQHETLTNGKIFAKGNYAAFVSPFHVEYQNYYSGALKSKGRQRTADIRDGLSNTLFATEILTSGNRLDQRGAWALPWNATSLLAFDMHHKGKIGESKVYRHDVRSIGLTQTPNNQGPNVDILYDCPDPAMAQLERMPCNTFVAGTNTAYLSAAPRSRHANGVNVVFLDGRVTFLVDYVDEVAMAHMVSSNDHEVVDFAMLR